MSWLNDKLLKKKEKNQQQTENRYKDISLKQWLLLFYEGWGDFYMSVDSMAI